MKVKDNKQIATWLYFGAGTIIIQILLGGITRLTGSGLSITEWQPLLGTIPPLNQSAWQTSFDKYKEIAQFHIVNSHFTLEDYKSIFFWEWLHRNWARFIGIAFLFPLIYFLIRKKIEKKLLFSLLFLFILGLLQAIIGWIMVKSGLNDINIKVNHIRLSIHFVAALILLCYT
ncbi:COX15/CtaA family protein, partial [Pedobacter hiemivivus]